MGVNVAGMFTNDIVGNTLREDGTHDRSHVRLFAEGVPPLATMSPAMLTQLRTGGDNDFSPRQLARLIQSVGAQYVPQLPVQVIYRRDRYLRGGDHSPFLDAGFPAVRFTEPREAFTRQHEDVGVRDGVLYGDTVDFVDFAYVAEVARVNAAALAELSLAPAAPRNVELESIKLENDSTLRWTANTEPDLGRLSHCLARHDVAGVGTRSRGRQRDPLHREGHFQGQRDLRRGSRGSRRTAPVPPCIPRRAAGREEPTRARRASATAEARRRFSDCPRENRIFRLSGWLGKGEQRPELLDDIAQRDAHAAAVCGRSRRGA